MKANKTIRWKVISDNNTSEFYRDYSKKFILSYKKNRITKAPKGTFGIFVYKTKRKAKREMDRFHPCKMIKVKTYGKAYTPKRIYFISQLRNKKIYSKEPKCPIPADAICYPAVMLLE